MYGYGGIVSFVLNGGIEELNKFLKNLKIFKIAESLGGVESLIEVPSIMTHASIPKEEREKRGIYDTLVRISAGIEDTEDLLEDLSRGFEF